MKNNNFGAVKGHFYNVEKRFKSIEGLRSEMEKKGLSIGIDKSEIKKCMGKLKQEHNYLWIITNQGAYVLDDLRLNHDPEVQSRFKALLGFARYVFNITTWKVDNYRMSELKLEKLLG